MRQIVFKQMMLFLFCVPFILFSSSKASAQTQVPVPQDVHTLYNNFSNDWKNAGNDVNKQKQVAIKHVGDYPEISIPDQINDAMSKKNYAQVYSILENNKNKLISIRNLNDLQADVEYYYKSKNDLLTEVKKLNALLRDVKQGRAKYSDYVDQAKALQKKNKQLIIEKNNGFLAIDTSVAEELKQDVGNLDKALSVLNEVCNGVCNTK